VVVTVIGFIGQIVGAATVLDIARWTITLVERAFQFHVGDGVTAPVALND
jgi:hypothetical protein